MEAKEKIKEVVEKACKKKGITCKEIKIERPSQEKYGDYAAIPYNCCKKKRKDYCGPSELSEVLEETRKDKGFKKYFKRVEQKGPFFNFFLSDNYLEEQLKKILDKKEKFSKLNNGKGKKVQVEFISANPTGPLTIGNARGGPFGDVLGNVLEKAGFEVEKAYYVNNYGNQILALGHSVLKDNQAQYKGEYIDQLNKRIKEKDPYKAGEKAAKIILEEMIKKTTDKLGIDYNEWFFEKELHESKAIEKVINSLDKKGLVYKKEGALWFKSKDFGDERDRVLIRKDGTPTYLAGDIAYHSYKFKDKGFDKVINIWGADHYGDIPGLKAGVEALGYKDQLEFVLLQFVTLLDKGKELKMSKRKGVYVTMDELLEEVSSDVVRFFFLQRSAGTHLKFDLSLAKEQSKKNPVYYVQYAHARICSVLEQEKKSLNGNFELLKHPSEISLIKELIKLPEIVEETANDFQLQRLPQYGIKVAEDFHKFYRDCKILCDDKKMKEARMSLALATKIILKEVLDLMGVSAPEKM